MIMEMETKKIVHGLTSLNLDHHGANPFEYSSVLEVFFEHCSIKLLKLCRLCCKSWYSKSINSWREYAQVKLADETKTHQFLELVENENRPFLEGAFPIPHTFVLKDAIPPPDNRFWEVCGQSVKELTLTEIEFESIDIFRQILYCTCPNLESLSLDGCKISDNSAPKVDYLVLPSHPSKLKSLSMWTWNPSHFEGVSWREFLNHFSTIETLALVGDYGEEETSLLSALVQVREEDLSKLKLKHLKVYWDSEYYHDAAELVTRILLDSRLQMETICISLMNDAYDADVLQGIFRIHRGTLKTLMLWGWSRKLEEADHESWLETLKVLRLHYPQSVNSMTFLKWAPNLKLFEMHRIAEAIRGTELFDMEGVSLQKCTELSMGQYDTGSLTVEELRLLGNWFPNLIKLKIRILDNETFAIVCELWSNLMSLYVWSALVDDCGLSGLDKEDVQRINESGKSSSWRPITVPRANVTSLKYLRSLEMNGTRHRLDTQVVTLGYCAAVCGIQNIPNLQDLRLNKFRLKPEPLWAQLQCQFGDNIVG